MKFKKMQMESKLVKENLIRRLRISSKYMVKRKKRNLSISVLPRF
jgi:hypothetical protein